MSAVGFGISISKQSIKGIQRAFTYLPNEVISVVKKYSKKSMESVLHAARSKCPVDTGLLVSSLRIKQKYYKRSGVIDTMVGPDYAVTEGAGKNMRRPAKYAHIVELGTIYQRAQPFLKPAIEANAQRVINEYSEGLVKGVDKLCKKYHLPGVAA